MEYKLHLNLNQRIALRTAILFWQKKHVKDRIIEFCESYNKLTIHEVLKKWDELSETLINEWIKSLSPFEVKAELIHIVKMIGETIFNWYQFIKHEYKIVEEAISFIDKIHWTSYGTVDAIKTFKSSWLVNPHLNITKVYNFACNYALVEYINNLWSKIPKAIQKSYNNIDKRFDQHILAYWKYCRDGELSYLMKYLELHADDFNRQNREVSSRIYDLTRSTEDNMLRLSVYEGYFIITKYLWEQLTEVERNKSVLACARIAVLRCYYCQTENKNIANYKKSQYAEICVFLMNQMSGDHKKAFFNEKINSDNSSCINNVDVKDEILKMLLSAWPWQELLIPVLKDMLQYQDDNSTMTCVFLDDITYKIDMNHQLGYSVKSNKYQSLFREAWVIIPVSIKQKIVQDNHNLKFVCNLVNARDFDSLKVIFNDPEITTERDEFIKLGLCSYHELIENDMFEALDHFINEFLRSEEEKKQFKQKIDILMSLLNKGHFHLADKLLDWQCSTDEERQSFKRKVDHKNICEHFINIGDYDQVDKFLNFKFNTTAEKKRCKDDFINDVISIRKICEIWQENKNDINKASNESYRFLHWFLESENEIELFKKEIVVSFNIDNPTMFYFGQFKRDGIIDDFISWCMLDDEQFQQVQSLKQAVFQSNQRLV